MLNAEAFTTPTGMLGFRVEFENLIQPFLDIKSTTVPSINGIALFGT